jgi:hypothetical protein
MVLLRFPNGVCFEQACSPEEAARRFPIAEVTEEGRALPYRYGGLTFELTMVDDLKARVVLDVNRELVVAVDGPEMCLTDHTMLSLEDTAPAALRAIVRTMLTGVVLRTLQRLAEALPAERALAVHAHTAVNVDRAMEQMP